MTLGATKFKLDFYLAIFSAFVAAVGLFLNYDAVQKNNRIVVSTKLVEASKLLSDELVARVRSYQMYKSELQEAQIYPESEAKTKKVSGLEKLLEANLARQKQIDKETDDIDALFFNLDQADPGKIDMMISRSYRSRSAAAASFELAQEIKKESLK